MDLTVHYQLNGDDGLEALDAHRPLFRRSRWLNPLAATVIVAVGTYLLTIPEQATPAWVAIALGIVLFAVSVIQRLAVERTVRRVYDQLGPIELTVHGNGYRAQGLNAVSEVLWSRYIRLHETERLFLLYESRDVYAIVPKRTFASKGDVDAFRETALRGLRGAGA